MGLGGEMGITRGSVGKKVVHGRGGCTGWSSEILRDVAWRHR